MPWLLGLVVLIAAVIVVWGVVWVPAVPAAVLAVWGVVWVPAVPTAVSCCDVCASTWLVSYCACTRWDLRFSTVTDIYGLTLVTLGTIVYILGTIVYILLR